MHIDIDALYRKFGSMVYRRCLFLLRDEDSALDAMQEVFVQLIRFKDRLDSSGPSSLLYTMATNHCLNVLKARKRQPYIAGERLFDTIAAKNRDIEQVIAKDTLEHIFATQDERTRLIAWLHFVDGMTLEETAEKACMSVSGIRKRIRKLSADSTSFKEHHHVN